MEDMSAEVSEPGAIRDFARRGAAVDGKTLALLLAMGIGFPWIVWQHAAGNLPFWAGFLLASILMNLSFAAWHEPSHGNFSSWETVNHAAGFLASFFSLYPGYFARRREHLIHHRWEGVPGKDPVYARIQTGFLGFPFRLAGLTLKGQPLDVPVHFLPITSGQRFSDGLSTALVAGAVLLSFLFGFWKSLIGLWVLPRIAIFFLHAYYVFFFPHAMDGGGYEVHRVREGGFWLRFITVDQNYHGIHHRWPFIPWHRYREVLDRCPREVEAAGIRLVHGLKRPREDSNLRPPV